MTPAVIAKQAGLKSLAELSEISMFSVDSLKRMAKNHPDRFKRQCQMAVSFKRGE